MDSRQEFEPTDGIGICAAGPATVHCRFLQEQIAMSGYLSKRKSIEVVNALMRSFS